MESLEEYISPFTGDFAELPEDYDENGEMNEQGKKKLEKLKKIIEIMQEYEKVDSRKLEIYKKKLEDHYDLTENECQEKLKTILADHKREEDFKTEDQFDSFTLNINFQKEDHKKMFSDLLTTRVPKIHTLYLAYISKDDIENLKTFLVKSFPHRLETLVFNFSGHPKSKDDLLDLEPFIDLLVDISALVDSEIQIWNCSITAEILNKLVVHFCHVNKFWICWSWFNFEKGDNLNFMMSDEPKISEINFEGCGDEVLNDWGKNSDSLSKIMKAFKNSDIKDQIKQVLFDDCNLDEPKIEEIMNENGISYNK